MSEVNGSAHMTAGRGLGSRDEAAGDGKAPISVVPPHAIASLVEIAASAPSGGCFVEVGVYKGGTAFHLSQVATEQGRMLFLFDTFEGIPFTNKEMGDTHKIGDFNDTSYEEVVAAVPNAITTKGLFPDSLNFPIPPIAFAHIDADQYDSIVNSMMVLSQYMMKGGVVVFDDYGCLEGATAAVIALYGEDRIEITKAGKALVRY